MNTPHDTNEHLNRALNHLVLIVDRVKSVMLGTAYGIAKEDMGADDFASFHAQLRGDIGVDVAHDTDEAPHVADDVIQAMLRYVVTIIDMESKRDKACALEAKIKELTILADRAGIDLTKAMNEARHAIYKKLDY